MEEDCCAKCGKLESAVSNMTIDCVFKTNLVPTCGHKFCELCIENGLRRQRQFPCPTCNTMVTREKLSLKSLDENEIERDFRIRRQILSIYNKTEEQFNSLDDFKDYEELREDIIYNLVHEIDVAATNAMVEKYQSENISLITSNQSKVEAQLKREAIAIKSEEEERKKRIEALQDSIAQEKANKKLESQQINSFLLGESDSLPASMDPNHDKANATAIASQQQQDQQQASIPTLSAPSAVQLFLYQRPQPVPKAVSASTTTTRSDASKKGPVDMSPEVQRAGGFNAQAEMRRNWVEFVSTIGETVASYRQEQHCTAMIYHQFC